MQNDAVLTRQLWLVGVGFFMQTLDSTIVNTALPSMAQEPRRSAAAHAIAS